jgi:hypothetical protein
MRNTVEKKNTFTPKEYLKTKKVFILIKVKNTCRLFTFA